MATVTGLTAERMLEIEAASVIDGDVIDEELILTKHDGSQINAGNVRGPQGEVGPVGQDTVLTLLSQVLDVGLANQIRAGRQLALLDFTMMGVAAPLGLWNLSNLVDSSGNGRNLLNKGTVPFAVGINGAASTAAQFAGSTAQALYIADTGGADPFRIKTGSWGCWAKTAKKGVANYLLAKNSPAAGNYGWELAITSTGFASAAVSSNGTATVSAVGNTDVADDRWHFLAGTHDGTFVRIYVDGVLENVAVAAFPIFGGSGPLNVGGYGADASTASASPHFGRIDETFVTADVLSDEQIRYLYCAKFAHSLGVPPSRMSLNVRYRRRGAALISGDFATQPLRLYNFSAGSLGDQGSDGVALTNNGTAIVVAGADGSQDNAFHFAGAQSLSSSDAGLPAALTSRSFGCWVKTTALTAMGFLAWGTINTADARIRLNNGIVEALSGADTLTGVFIADGRWHHVACVENNTSIDGVKRKLYVDGRLVGISTTLTSLTLSGANKFRIGSSSDGTNFFTGQIDAAFVCAVALSFEEIALLYAKGSGAFDPSPKNVGDHIEIFESTRVLMTFDTLESTALIDLGVAE